VGFGVGEIVGIEVVVGVDVGVVEIVAVEVDVIVIVEVEVEVMVCVGVIEEISVKVGDTGMMTITGVGDGMNGGVGERIAGRGDGQVTGVATTSGI
jgi:hypothetical protein